MPKKQKQVFTSTLLKAKELQKPLKPFLRGLTVHQFILLTTKPKKYAH